jgi:hypothetical protein
VRYDEKKRLVKVHILDPNVMRKLRQFMEENGWYDEFQLNPKLFQCRLDFFISLCSKLENDDFELTDDSKAKLKEKKTYKNESETGFINKILAGGVEEGMKSLAVTASKELILAVLNAIPMGGCAALAIKGICSVIEKS